MEKTIEKYQIIEVLNRFIALELCFTMVLWKKKLWYYGKKYGTIPKTMEL